METTDQKPMDKEERIKLNPDLEQIQAEMMAQQEEDVPWTGIRPDLVLHKGAPIEGELDTYILEDPVSGATYELGESEAKLFYCLLAENDVQKAVNRLILTTSVRPSMAHVQNFIKMLNAYKLTNPVEIDEKEIIEEKEPKAQIKEFGVLGKLFRAILNAFLTYMSAVRGQPKQKKKKADDSGGGSGRGFSLGQIYFFRIPILRPDRLLDILYPFVSPLWSKPFRYAYGVMGLLGLMMAIQQFELYLTTASYIFTFKGAVAFTAALYFMKILHEFGHAFATKHYGMYVRRMGIYMMFFVPMFYTDASEAWKIPHRRGRLMIGVAGVLVEFYAGMIALFFWAILPDGLLRSIMFFLSGSAIVSTLMTNLSPFMRFDGYYVLMDYLRITNLRPRAMALFKYYARKVLVGWRGPKPEEHPKAVFMALFGLGCHLYLLIIVFGIQISIYKYISELLALWGMFLLSLAFLVTPFTEEVMYLAKHYKYWGDRKAKLKRLAIIAGLAALVFVPTTSSDQIPAFFLYKDVIKVEAPGPGRVVSELPEIGTFVQQGDLLVQIQDDALDQQRVQLAYQLEQVEKSIESFRSGGAQGAYRKWLMAEQERLKAAQEKVMEQIGLLQVRSPISGKVVKVEEAITKGSYVHVKSYLLTVARDKVYEARAYVPENLYKILKKEPDRIADARIFIPDLETDELEGVYREMLDFPVEEFPNYTLFDFMQGPIVSELKELPNGERRIQPRDPQYPVYFDVPSAPEYLRHGTTCFLRIKGERISLWGRILREATRVLAKTKFL